MKAAKEWVNDFEGHFLGRVTSASQSRLVERIQADALEHATQLMTANADSPERAFKAVFNEMLRLRDQK
jgi:hypothetical protein